MLIRTFITQVYIDVPDSLKYISKDRSLKKKQMFADDYALIFFGSGTIPLHI